MPTMSIMRFALHRETLNEASAASSQQPSRFQQLGVYIAVWPRDAEIFVCLIN